MIVIKSSFFKTYSMKNWNYFSVDGWVARWLNCCYIYWIPQSIQIWYWNDSYCVCLSLLYKVDLNKYILKSNCQMIPLCIKIVVKGLWQLVLWDPSFFVNINLYTNKWCSRVIALQIWIKTWHKQNQKFFCLPQGFNSDF
jgi:hypothetical protein